MKVTPVKTRIFEEGENLAAFILEHIPRLAEGSVLAVTSKIVALAEGRTVMEEGARGKEKLIRAESDSAIKTKYVFVTLKDGTIMANAGIDESNAKEKLILLPKDSHRSAAKLWQMLKTVYKIKRLGIVLTDSRTAPLRAGVTAVAVGYAGIKGIRDYRTKRDLFGRAFRFTRVNVPDSLATAAAFTMGEGAERQPLAVVVDAPVEFTDRVSKKELRIPPADDMYGPLLKLFFTKKH